MERTRIILIGMPRMLGELIRELVMAQPDLTLVAEFDGQEAVLQAIQRSRADVAITSLDGPVRASVTDLLAQVPALKVLAVSADGSESFLYELRPHERILGDVSPQTLLAAIRGQRPSVQTAAPDSGEAARC